MVPAAISILSVRQLKIRSHTLLIADFFKGVDFTVIQDMIDCVLRSA